VPIFDGRNCQIKLPDDLKNLSEKLPRFDGIVPDDSFVVASYTVVSYLNNRKEFKIANNILWAVVLCGENASVFLFHLKLTRNSHFLSGRSRSHFPEYWWWNDPFFFMMDDHVPS
jgi:hypothetical protein